MFKKLRMNLNVFTYYSDVIVKAILKRYRFTYGIDAVFGVVSKVNCIVRNFCCCCCRRYKREIKLITKSVDKVNNDLCVINLINSLNRVKIMERILFNKQ